jgi:hypothetical protein
MLGIVEICKSIKYVTQYWKAGERGIGIAYMVVKKPKRVNPTPLKRILLFNRI